MKESTQSLKARATFQLLESEVETRRLGRLTSKVSRLKSRLSKIKKRPTNIARSVRKQDLMDSISFYRGEIQNSKRFIKRLKR